MKKYFVVAYDSLGRPKSGATFETRKECENWYYSNYDLGGCSFKIRLSKKIVLPDTKTGEGGNLSSMFECDMFNKLNYYKVSTWEELT